MLWVGCLEHELNAIRGVVLRETDEGAVVDRLAVTVGVLDAEAEAGVALVGVSPALLSDSIMGDALRRGGD